MIEIKGENNLSLCIEERYGRPYPCFGIWIEKRSVAENWDSNRITLSRAELIKAIWPEGVEGLEDMVDSWGYKAIRAETLDNAKKALAISKERK